MPVIDLEEGAAWVRSRPKVVQNLMRRFPPSCLVRANRPLGCPAPGEIGQVASYLEGGSVTVTAEGNPLRAECDPEWLEIVGYQYGITPEWVASVLDS